MKNLNTKQTPTWCPGCDNYKVLAALKGAIDDLKIAPRDIVMCYDIGCGGNMVNLLNVCAVETLHGRSIPVASGIKAVRDDLAVIAQAGDGGLLNEGLNHFVHAASRDDNITLIVNNNLIFGLTAGQRSSATPKSVLSRADQGSENQLPLSIVDLAAISGARFICRVEASNIASMQNIIKQAICFKGFAVVEIIEPCKIWAKSFPKVEYKEVAKPIKDRKSLIGKDNITGLLFQEKTDY